MHEALGISEGPAEFFKFFLESPLVFSRTYQEGKEIHGVVILSCYTYF